MEKKKILIVCFKNLVSSRRTYRQIVLLKEKYDVYTMGFEDSGIAGVKFYPVKPRFKYMSTGEKLFSAFLFLFSMFDAAYDHIYDFKEGLEQLKGIKFDLIIVHDLKPMPLVYRIDPEPKILFDAHEYFYDVGGFSLVDYFLLDRFDKYLLKKYFLSLKNITTVNDWIAEQYRKVTNAKIDVIISASEYFDTSPHPVNGRKIRIIHHGIADPNRKLENMIELAGMLDERFEFHLMLTTNAFSSAYYKKLQQLAAEKRSVKLIPAVAPGEIVPFISQYDIGLYVLNNLYLNQQYSLPNKFFEFIQARLMLAITPNTEMKKLVEQYDLGIVSQDYRPQTLAAMINALTTEQIEHYRMKSHQAAKILSAEGQMEKLNKIIGDLL